MRFSLSSLARFVAGTVLISSAAAIGLARLAPPPRGWRMLSPGRYANVNSFYLDPCRRGSSWIDRESGAMIELPFRDDELLEYGACSPWRDEEGRTQVVGRWSWGFRGETPEMAYGLARVSFPDGKILDHVETEIIPVSNPCWYPGTRARVIFAAGDGKLYHYAFESGDSADRRDERPRPVIWNCQPPDDEGVYMAEPHWSSDPDFSHLLFVGLRSTRRGNGHPSSTATRIWWLRLSEDGGSIEEAGRLIAPPADDPEINERCPIFGRAADGRPVVAYLRKAASKRSDLYLADIELDPETRSPRPATGPGLKIVGDCLPNPPILSGDGRWVTIVEGNRGNTGVVRRVRTDVGSQIVDGPPSP